MNIKRIMAAGMVGMFCMSMARAVDFTWNGNGGDSKWTTAANWDKNLGYPRTAADQAFVSAADALHMDTNSVVSLYKFDFSPVSLTNLTVTGDEGAGLAFTHCTVGGASVVEFLPDITLSAECWKSGTGILDVPGKLTTSQRFNINDGILRIAGGNAVFGGIVSVGSSGKTATLQLTEGGTMQWNSTITSAGGTRSVRLSGGTLRVNAGGNCYVPLLVDGSNTIDTTVLLNLTEGLSVTGQGHLIKSGSAGLKIKDGCTNFVSGALTISNSYVQFSMNTLYESYGGSIAPWHVRVCNGGRFFVGSVSTIFTVPLDLVMEPGGTVEFAISYGDNRNTLVAHSIVTNGVSLPPGRYTDKTCGFIPTGGSVGGAGSVVLATRWTGAGDGVSWTNANNWNGPVPDGPNAVADISNAQGPLDLGGENVTLTCLVYNPQGTQRAVTVTGAGTLNLYAPSANAGCLVVGPGRTLTLDVAVARVSGSSSLGIFGNGTVIVKKGFPAGVPTGKPSVGIMGNLIFDGTTAITGDTYNILSMNALSQPNSATYTNLFDSAVTFATNCRMTLFGILGSAQGYYPVSQIIHDGAEIAVASVPSGGYVFITRYADYYPPPFAYFMRAGKLTVPSNSGFGIAIGANYSSSWLSSRRGGGAFVMTGGEVTTPKVRLGTPESVLTLQGGDVYLGSGGILSDTNIQGAVNLGGVAIHAAANWGSSLNLTMTGEGGATVFDTAARTVTLSGVLSGTGGLTKTGTGTLTLSGTNFFEGGVTVAGGTLVASNGLLSVTNLSVAAAGAVLVIGCADSLSSNAALTVVSGGLLNLNYSGTATVNALVVAGEEKSPGTYNSGKSFITGTGALRVLNGPPPYGTLLSIQ